ncbi:MAG TPA: hypothetical protein VFD03_02110 [Clostridia bacterium]|nr:hypothetical protein [Clostridia bacterium]
MSTEITEMSFEELSEQIKQEFGTLLPESSYNSPASLIEAMTALSHTGYKHIFNARAYRVLDAAVHLQDLVFTTRDLAEYSGLPLKSVQDCISIWNRYHYKYFTKLHKRLPHGANRYKLRKWGTRTYLDMKNRIHHNFDLNRQLYSPKKVDCYFVLDKYCMLRGLKESDLPKSL